MPFDIKLAIAAMPQHNGSLAEDQLRSRYPELAFLFDEVADLREMVEGHDDELKSAEESGYYSGYDDGYADGVSAASE
jgi:hypothetical protein